MLRKKFSIISAISAAVITAFMFNTKAVAEDASPNPTAQTAVEAAPDYKISPGDVINITVANFPNLNAQVTVPPDGRVTLALINVVQFTGRTTSELQNVLIKKWNEYVVDPAVTVALTTKHVDHIVVYGYVLKPGQLDVTTPMRASAALGAAGGSNQAADLCKVVVTHLNGEKVVLDMSHPVDFNGTDKDIVLAVGDSMYVPERRMEVNVIGEVKTPGAYDFREGITVMDALTLAGGVLADTADLANAKLTHNGTETDLDLYAMLKKGDMAGNIKLSSGDRIIVPEFQNRTYVFGAVNRPGMYLYKSTDHMLDALNGVGGPTTEADLSKVNLIRLDKDKNITQMQKINIGEFLKKGDAKFNVVLLPGDVLYVPTRSRGFNIQDVFSVLQGLSLANTGARVFSHGLGH